MTILWLIERLLVKPTEGTLTDVVITADWRCNGSQENYSGTIVGSEITSQYTLNPGDSLEGQPVEVVNIANALWI